MSDKTVRITFQNETNSDELVLDYKLNENKFTDKWFALYKEILKHPGFHIELNGEFFGPDFDDISLIVSQLKENISDFNEVAQEIGATERLEFEPHVGMSQNLLVKMHDKFEEYAHDNRFVSIEKSQLALSNFNINIHRAENFLPHIIKNGSHAQAIIHPIRHVALDEEDYQYFTTDYNWGDLYVVYGMSGQPTLNAFHGKSMPRPQDCMTAGLQLMFLNDLKLPEILRNECKIYMWENHEIDIDEPRAAMGYLHLGKMIDKPKDRISFMKKLSEYKKIIKLEAQGETSIRFQDLNFTVSGAGEHVIDKRGTEGLQVDDRMKEQLDRKKDCPEDIQQTPPSKSEKIKISDHQVDSNLQHYKDIPAEWPYDREIFYHLDYIPYIDLGVRFNPKKLIEEANKALDYFVTHRGYDQSKTKEDAGQWKSLSLQSVHGDYTKTSYHTEYGLTDGEGVYAKTPFATLCPETWNLITSLTDPTRCERIRFMLLEPGAKIHPHRDMKDGSTGMAVNISLNMPEGCEFSANLNQDGTKNDYTVQLPFSDQGSVILFNNGKYHSVVNNSNTPRMHIIFHGPIKLTDEEIIELARKQNNINSRREIVEKLGRKKVQLVEDLEQDPDFYSEWKSLGYSRESNGSSYSFAILDHNLPKDIHKKVTDNITLASIFPKPFEMVKFDLIDQYLRESLDKGNQFAVLVNQGTYFKDIRKFNVMIEKAFQQMKAENAVCMGHIMDFQDDNKIPYIHEQFLIVNLSLWDKVGRTSPGELFNNTKLKFPNHNKSKACVHDDYTPWWIGPGEQIHERSGENNFCTRLMIDSIQAGYKVLNVPDEIRPLKEYAYPLQKLDHRYDNIRNQINGSLEYCANLTFYFNNEDLDFIQLPNFKPDTFVSVSAGFKPLKMAEMFWRGRAIKNVQFIDYSPKAIDYMKSLVSLDDTKKISSLIEKLSSVNPGETYSAKQAELQLHGIIRDYFNDDEKYFFETLEKLSQANFTQIDLIGEQEKFTSLLKKNQTSMIWVSNAFYCNPLYYILSKEEADAEYLKFGKSIADLYGETLWKHKTSYTFIVGNSPEKEIKSIITDGCVFDREFYEGTWEKIS